MPYLAPRPDLDQLRHQAKDLLHAAQAQPPDSLARPHAYRTGSRSDRLS